MRSTPLTCCSIGNATVLISVLALAPGYRVVTCTTGGVIGGYCATGSTLNATAPTSTITMASTFERIGRSMKNLENTGGAPPLAYWPLPVLAAPAGAGTSAATGGALTRCGLTLEPGIARWMPSATTQSSAVTPFVMTRMPLTSAPTST